MKFWEGSNNICLKYSFFILLLYCYEIAKCKRFFPVLENFVALNMMSPKIYLITKKIFDKNLLISMKQNFCYITVRLCTGSESRTRTYAAPCRLHAFQHHHKRFFFSTNFFFVLKLLHLQLAKQRYIHYPMYEAK